MNIINRYHYRLHFDSDGSEEARTAWERARERINTALEEELYGKNGIEEWEFEFDQSEDVTGEHI